MQLLGMVLSPGNIVHTIHKGKTTVVMVIVEDRYNISTPIHQWKLLLALFPLELAVGHFCPVFILELLTTWTGLNQLFGQIYKIIFKKFIVI